MLDVVVAAADREIVLGPDDLGSYLQAAGLKALLLPLLIRGSVLKAELAPFVGPLLDKILLTKRSIMPYCRHGETERV